MESVRFNTGFDGTLVTGMSHLCAIVETGNFVKAAQLLDVRPSAVTRTIAKLEARLGVRFLNRTTRSVSLTDEGRRFHERIAPLMLELQEASSLAAGDATEVRGRLGLDVGPLFSRVLLAPRLSEFTSRHPGIELEILTRDDLGDIVADGFDLAIRFGIPVASSLVARRLLVSRVLTVAAPSYLRRAGRPESPQDLFGDRHICIQFRDPSTARPFPWQFVQGQTTILIDARGPVTLNDAHTMLELCLGGHGLAQTMLLGCEEHLRVGRLVDVFPDWADEVFPLYAYYPSRQWLPAKVRRFLDFVVEMQAPGADSC